MLILENMCSKQRIQLDIDKPLILGRNNIHKCHDKRVSRNHCRVTCTTDQKIILVALHSNPCFYTRNGVPPVLQLNKNEEIKLNEGDCLGFLQDTFWFHITKSREIKSEPMLNSEESNNESLSGDTTVVNEINSKIEKAELAKDCHTTGSSELPSSKKTVIPEPAMPCSSKASTSSESSSSAWGYGCPEFEKTKRLPLWMYQIDELKDPKLNSKAESETKKLKFEQAVNSCANSSTKSPLSFLENANLDINSSKHVDLDIHSDIHKEVINSRSNLEESDFPVFHKDIHKEVINSRSNLEESDISVDRATTSNVLNPEDTNKREKEGYENYVPKRPICQYESNCYRKNPEHKQEFAHPGDEDYVSYENRPMCQYGASCYRRNQMHKVEFRHPSPNAVEEEDQSPRSYFSSSPVPSPLPAKRKRKSVKVQDADFSNEDEFDLEDPFTNDASSDEFVPSASEIEGESDAFEDD